MSLEAMQWAFRQTVGRSSDKLILLSLADISGNEHLAWPSHQRLERDTELNRKTIKDSLKRLMESGFIRDTGERRGATRKVVVYQLSVGRDVNKTENGPIKQAQNRAYSEEVMGPKTDGNGPKNGHKWAQKRAPEPIKEPTKEPKINNIGQVDQVLEHINTVCNRSFKFIDTNRNHVKPLFKHYTLSEIFLVIDFKNDEWGWQPEMRKFLRPETLFKGKFESYLQNAIEWHNAGRPSHETIQRNRSGYGNQQPRQPTVEQNNAACERIYQELSEDAERECQNQVAGYQNLGANGEDIQGVVVEAERGSWG